MQNTRLNSLIAVSSDRLIQWLQNPWRRISLLIISLLFGNFLATVIATTTGQTADWDVFVALILVGFTELSNWFFYSRSGRRSESSRGLQSRSLIVELLNGVKLGLLYGLFVEAFKLGS